ncbi:MAG: hypothetical protein L0Y44_09840 [Phycisphaerales bacterium]|nr:hypothetical protein [Phycisphaerales bacterium]
MNRLRFRLLLVPALLLPVWGCEGLTVVEVTSEPMPTPRVRPLPRRVETTTTTTVVERPYGHQPPPPAECPPEFVPPPPKPYAHLPQRTSFSPKASVELKEGCYEGDFVLGSSQIRISGAGVGKTVIHGNLVVQTQCVVSKLTVTGDVIFEGHQAELVDSDFFGEIIDKGTQNRY